MVQIFQCGQAQFHPKQRWATAASSKSYKSSKILVSFEIILRNFEFISIFPRLLGVASKDCMCFVDATQNEFLGNLVVGC